MRIAISTIALSAASAAIAAWAALHSLAFAILLAVAPAVRAEEPEARRDAPTFITDIAPILTKYCTGCHNAEEREGELVLESYAALLQGGESGAVIASGKSRESRLWLVLAGKAKPPMPPPRKPQPSPAEIETIRRWIDSGAAGPAPTGGSGRVVETRRIEPRGTPPSPVRAVAFDAVAGTWIVGAQGTVELLPALIGSPAAVLEGPRGAVNAIAVAADAGLLAAAGGEAGICGEATLWRREGRGWAALGRLEAGSESLYAVAISASGGVVATGGYDQRIVVWDARTLRRSRVLSGHNGAVFDLAFRADSRILASASADRTVKLWEVESGRRLDTLSQPLKDLYALAFSPDGRLLAAGGKDSRIRIWEVSASGEEGQSSLLVSRFAHEGAILDLAYSSDGKLLASSADDGSVKCWEAESLVELVALARQPDWPAALAFGTPRAGAVVLAVGRLDGITAYFDALTGREMPGPARRERTARAPRGARPGGAAAAGASFALLVAAPALTLLEEKPPAPQPPVLLASSPRGVERGRPTTLRLAGERLDGLREVVPSSASITARLLPGGANGGTEALLEVTAAGDTPRGAHRIALVGAASQKLDLDLLVDDTPQAVEIEPNATPAQATSAPLPAGFWGAISQPGDVDVYSFAVPADSILVIELETRRIGSELNGVLTLLDPAGRPAATRSAADGDGEVLLVHRVSAAGVFAVAVGDRLLAGSAKRFYRLNVGPFAYVTSCFPPTIAAHGPASIELRGHNLPAGASVPVSTKDAGEIDVPLDPARFRSRRSFRLAVSTAPVAVESEPNNRAGEANPVPAPGKVCGRLQAPAASPAVAAEDADLFRFAARAGETWILETEAARRGSSADTRIEVLFADGRPVPRVRLEAVRDSAITFRGIDSETRDVRLTNWEEMDLNQLVYFQGEVVRLFRMPQGPDSGFLLYESNGRRRAYFDTSASAHPNEEPCYVVEARPPGAALPSNGLPAFDLDYANDDDGLRQLGRDSRLTFVPPTDGEYLVRVTDANHASGDDFVYTLSLRHARPDFSVTLSGADPTIPAGSGKSFTVAVDRADGFEGAVTVELQGLPPGIVSTQPLIVEAGQRTASGTLWCAPDAPLLQGDEGSRSKATAKAVIHGEMVERAVNGLGKIAVAPRPKLVVRLEPILDEGWEARALAQSWSGWQVLVPAAAVSHGGADLKIAADGGILAAGRNPDTDTYTVVCTTEAAGITAFRLEALLDDSLPHGGPGRGAEDGAFVLSELRVTVSPLGQSAQAAPVALQNARASSAEAGAMVGGAIDGRPDTGWAPDHGGRRELFAVFETVAAVGGPGPSALVFTIDHASALRGHNLGRLRISATSASRPHGPVLPEIVVARGQVVPAMLRVERNGYDDLVTFSVENLPHGVIVDNIGLSGVLLPARQNERRIFISCASWVEPAVRPCHALAQQEGNPTSPPVLLRVVGK